MWTRRGGRWREKGEEKVLYQLLVVGHGGMGRWRLGTMNHGVFEEEERAIST